MTQADDPYRAPSARTPAEVPAKQGEQEPPSTAFKSGRALFALGLVQAAIPLVFDHYDALGTFAPMGVCLGGGALLMFVGRRRADP
ncbi:MAG: hypothetical protein KDD82_20575 [Planctomycetes bacterium]|nr:hypothetical protein [Planctomycetota bacterium]